MNPADELMLVPTDRLLILAPHPDDEVLGCGGLIHRAVRLGVPTRVAFLTFGDSNQWSFIMSYRRFLLTRKWVQSLALMRHDEAVASAGILGLSQKDLVFLGYPDRGALNIWKSEESDPHPYQSLFGQYRAVPYQNAYRPGAPFRRKEVLRDLSSIVREFGPTRIFVSHPEDMHPDHRALFWFAQAVLEDDHSDSLPSVYTYIIHHRRWPRKRQSDPTRPLEPPATLETAMHWQRVVLSQEDITHKLQALQAYHSQYRYNARYLLSFVRANELFGEMAPCVADTRSFSRKLQVVSRKPIHPIEPV